MRIVQGSPAVRWAGVLMVGCTATGAAAWMAREPVPRRPESKPPRAAFVDLPTAACQCLAPHTHPADRMLEPHTGGVLRVRATTAHSIRIYRGYTPDKLEAVCDVEHLGNGCYLDGDSLVLNYYIERPDAYERIVVPVGAPILGSFDRDYEAILRAGLEKDDTRWSFIAD